MSSNKSVISPIQARMLKEARKDPLSAARGLSRIVRIGEALAPEWRQIWREVRDYAGRFGDFSLGLLEEIDRAVEAIPRLADLSSVSLNENSRVCILLGAGASAPEPSCIPTVANLLPELWRRARKLGRDDIDRLASWCEKHEVSNIEDLLTAAYLSNFAAKNSSVSALLRYFLFTDRGPAGERSIGGRAFFRPPTPPVDAASVALFQETLLGLFGLLAGTMIPAPPNAGHDQIAKFASSHLNTSVVTTNYDGCLDEALIRSEIKINTYLDSDEHAGRSIDLIKIHGSINWTYCDSCHAVREFDLLSLKEAFERDTSSYAVVGICKNCGGQRRPLLIPPIGLKFIMFPNLIRLWNFARERIEGADLLIVVGFSFSEADSYINKIIERSMSLNVRQTMIVCDPNPDLVPGLKARYAARIDNFGDERVLEAIGSAAELLPSVFEAISTSRTRGGNSGHTDSAIIRKKDVAP